MGWTVFPSSIRYNRLQHENFKVMMSEKKRVINLDILGYVPANVALMVERIYEPSRD